MDHLKCSVDHLKRSVGSGIGCSSLCDVEARIDGGHCGVDHLQRGAGSSIGNIQGDLHLLDVSNISGQAFGQC